jgi:hypothetical protein
MYLSVPMDVLVSKPQSSAGYFLIWPLIPESLNEHTNEKLICD